VTISNMLDVHVHPRADTKVIVGGILALGNYHVRSSTNIHFLKNGRNKLTTESRPTNHSHSARCVTENVARKYFLLCMYFFVHAKALVQLLFGSRKSTGSFSFSTETEALS
jgi:hypothetical protein